MSRIEKQSILTIPEISDIDITFLSLKKSYQFFSYLLVEVQ